MNRKKDKKSRPSEFDIPEIDDELLRDANSFYWTFIRPAEEASDERKKKHTERRVKQKARVAEPTIQANLPTSTEPPTEEMLLSTIENIIQSTHHAYGWRHLGELGQQIRQTYPALQWSHYGGKKLLDFLQKYPALFKIKWSAPAHHGASHLWVRIAYEPKLKEGYKAK